MARRPTIADLAAAAGVSQATVDRVLNGRHAVRAETSHRVYAAAQAIGYHAVALIAHRMQPELPVFTLGVLLQHPEQAFYRALQNAIEIAARDHAGARVKLIVEFLPSMLPGDIAARLLTLGARVQAVALTSVDHHHVTRAVAELTARGVPVIALLSDFAQASRQSYLGLDNLRVGRTAAWMIAHGTSGTMPGAAPRPTGKIGIFVGGLRWHGHELREIGLRSFIREYAPDLLVLDSLVSLDTTELTYEATLALLARHDDLVGIYCAGGGMEGVIQAIREAGRSRDPGRRIEVVVNELTEVSRLALADGVISLVIATPLRQLATELISLWIAALSRPAINAPGQSFLPLELHLPESV